LQHDTAAKKGRFTAEVAANIALNRHHYRLRLRLKGPAAAAFAPTSPGQFAQFDASSLALPPIEHIPHDLADRAGRNILLRRPLSFADVRTEPSGDVILEVLYCVLGPATLRMTTLAPGDSISIIGPLGRGYSTSADKKLALLVAGGMGAPPLQHMATYLRQNRPDTKVLAFVGARSLQQLPYTVDHARTSSEPSYVLKEFADSGVMSLVATDDGSFGHKGFVTELLAEWLAKPRATADATIIYACG
jgi:dihydroorotate dehydrogenase electron transfer subunit